MMNPDDSALPAKANLKPNLAFRDTLLEDEYLRFSYQTKRNAILGGLIVFTLSLIFQPTAQIMGLSPEELPAFQILRNFIWFPTLIGGIAGAVFLKSPKLLSSWMAILCVYSGIYLAVLVAANESLAFEHIAFFTLILLIVTYFFTGLMFRWAALIALCAHVSQFLAVLLVHSEDKKLLLNICATGAVCGVVGFSSYRFERASRKAYFGQRQLQEEYRHRLAAERDRIRWLETVTGFLRHELKNAMTGIGSSLDLAEQTAVDPQRTKYLGRAKRSLEFMRRFLRQVSEATSLETSLAEHEFETVDFSQLVDERIHDYRDEIANRSFVGNVEGDVRVYGNVDRLVQMLDKLVNNAVEHGDAAHPIEIIVKAEQRAAILRVRDVGDSLPTDLNRIFEPFVSQKLRHPQGNLGLGLYVARAIATRHGGKIQATRLTNPTGAELSIELPRMRSQK
jgi:signal transduction histidine kinase